MAAKEYKVTVSIDADLKERLLTYCEENDCSMSAAFRQALKFFLDEEE